MALLHLLACFMLFLGKLPPNAHVLIERLHILQTKLMLGFEAKELVESQFEPQVLDLLHPNELGRIRSGSVVLIHEGVEIACYEEGDLLGLNRVFDLPYVQMKAQEPVVIERIHRDQFVSYITQDPLRQHRWSNYLLTLSALYQQMLMGLYANVNSITAKGFQGFQKGQTIIRQGEAADTVYQLMSGSAHVSVDGVRVGEVLEDEIFGAMAVFTGEKRSATVTANGDCQVLAIPKNQFVELIRAQPETAITLLNNMSRRITELNQQLLDAQPYIA